MKKEGFDGTIRTRSSSYDNRSSRGHDTYFPEHHQYKGTTVVVSTHHKFECVQTKIVDGLEY